MARRTAMSKEPGKVSIAVPDYEKARLNGGMRPMPDSMNNRGGFKTGGESYLPEKLPNPIDNQGNFAQGGGQLKRVSPGVYRNSQGQLVGSRGQQLRGGGRQDSNPMQSAIQGAAQGAGMGFGKGGSIASALQGAQQGAMDRGQMPPMSQINDRQFNDMMQRFNGPKDPQTMQAEAAAMAQQAAGQMGNQFGAGMSQGIAKDIGAGLGNLGMDKMNNPQWLGAGNGPGSPNDVNPWFGKQNGQPNAQQMQEELSRLQQMQQNPMMAYKDFNSAMQPMNPNQPLEQIAQGMQQKPGRIPPGMQSGYMQFPQGQQPPMQDLMYRFPQGQAPQFGQIFGRRLQQRQQPNTVSGLLQKQRG